MNLVKIFKEKTIVGWIFDSLSVLGIIALIVYLVRGGDAFTKVVPAVYITLIIGIVVNILYIFKPFALLEIVPFVLYLACFFSFVGSEANFLSNVFTGIDGNKIDPAFIIFALLTLMMSITSLVCCCLKPYKSKPTIKA